LKKPITPISVCNFAYFVYLLFKKAVLSLLSSFDLEKFHIGRKHCKYALVVLLDWWRKTGMTDTTGTRG
jgi:hypothetical protein